MAIHGTRRQVKLRVYPAIAMLVLGTVGCTTSSGSSLQQQLAAAQARAARATPATGGFIDAGAFDKDCPADLPIKVTLSRQVYAPQDATYQDAKPYRCYDTADHARSDLAPSAITGAANAAVGAETGTPTASPGPRPLPAAAAAATPQVTSAAAAATSAATALPSRWSLSQWQNISPAGVSIASNQPANNYGFQDIAVDPQQPNTIYVGTCYQGLWKTTNGGNSWFKVNTGTNARALDSGRLWSVKIDPIATQTIYAVPGYGVGGIWKSRDGGVNWAPLISSDSPVAQQLGGVPTPSNVAIDPADHMHLIASSHFPWAGAFGNYGGVGVIETNDGGSTWSVHAPVRNSGVEHQVMFLKDRISWIDAGSDGYSMTVDGGQTYTKVSSSISVANMQPVYVNGTIYANSIGVLRSADGGNTWQQVGPNAEIDAIVSSGSSLYAGDRSNGKYYYSSVSDGTTWVPYGSQQTCINSNCQGPYAMAYDPVNHIIYSSNWNAGVWRLQVGGS